VAAQSDNSTGETSGNLSLPTGEGVVLDIGTGDGRFVYRSAAENPNKFYIGIDANAAPLKKISMKATRKPAKGGLANVLFIQAAIENLPEELTGAADEIHIHFPWGSLLKSVALGDCDVLAALRRVAAPECVLEIIIGIDEERDKTEIERLALPRLSAGYLQKTLIPKYEAAGFQLLESGALDPADWSRLETSWARRLQSNDNRRCVYLVLQAND
jgi:16S rRNA (adenine(1408)-N(1))-methyltransferase